MADRKITELDALTAPDQKDLLYVVDDPSGSPVSKKISLYNLFGSVPANTSISGTLAVSGNTVLSGGKTTVDNGVITLTSSTEVASNNTTNVLGAGMGGSIFWDEN